MNIREQLIRDEGMRLKAYRDTQGLLTIGVGRNLDAVGLYPDEVDYLLDNDLRRVQEQVLIALPWTVSLDEARFGVLLNMCFNLGLRGLLKFREMLSAVETGDWTTAAVEMLDSDWAGQVGQRAERLAKQMEIGEWV